MNRCCICLETSVESNKRLINYCSTCNATSHFDCIKLQLDKNINHCGICREEIFIEEITKNKLHPKLLFLIFMVVNVFTLINGYKYDVTIITLSIMVCFVLYFPIISINNTYNISLSHFIIAPIIYQSADLFSNFDLNMVFSVSHIMLCKSIGSIICSYLDIYAHQLAHFLFGYLIISLVSFIWSLKRYDSL